ncbi:hypothetical protein FGE12_26405 [Aggregicoccus sp. 17bor-14]|uniref:hypothetical protein n=1 Tax=Myxococcaceae TaxID=31 RepID=UPI00129C9B4F|nr:MULTISPECIES: hypothetical protein [Myxococcaceae]MBF5045972.1 hypothetical protein [Simulacricoccus sp. 17bor-14]MRI91704.1 hypothetical protein [Aggregicoccus sp. 17bor-14]
MKRTPVLAAVAASLLSLTALAAEPAATTPAAKPAATKTHKKSAKHAAKPAPSADKAAAPAK